MHNKFDALEEYGGFKLSTKHQKEPILELMRKVREATICGVCWDFELNIPKSRMEDLPTDRIKPKNKWIAHTVKTAFAVVNPAKKEEVNIQD